MKWLLWKDYRVNLVIVLLAGIIIVAPHVIALFITWYNISHNIKGEASYFSMNLMASSGFSLLLSQIVFAFIGGNAFAGERPNRSVEFLAYLPIKRSKIIASKIILTLLIVASILIINLSIIGICWASICWTQGVSIIPQQLPNLDTILDLMLVPITGLVFFGMGWFFSSFLESPAFSVCLGLITPLLVVWIISSIVLYFDLQYTLIRLWYEGICITLAVAGFAAGTWYYLRYAEP